MKKLIAVLLGAVLLLAACAPASDSFDEAVENLQATAEASFSYAEIIGDESSVTMYLSDYGLGQEVENLRALGYGPDQEDWMYVKDLLISTWNAVVRYFDDCGYPNVQLHIIVVDDRDESTILLSVVDGVVIYDCLA